MNKKYVIGIDYGTDSVRAILVNADTGKEIAVAVKSYDFWAKAMFCNPAKQEYRQHPKDYIDGCVFTIKELVKSCSKDIIDNIVAINFDTTGSTPALVDKQGTPLALLPEFAENPNAMFVLWKDHSGEQEASEINALIAKWDVDYAKYSGGIYSSEWVWSKMLHVLRVDKSIREKAYSWVEHCDWMPALLSGNTNPKAMKRSRCAAGHKALWHEDWGGLPSEEFLTSLDPLLKGFRANLFTETYTSDALVGNLSQEWADRLGLHTNIKIGVGILDAHAGAVGAEIKAGALLKIVGTSTCDIMTAPYDEIKDKLIAGICGQVDGSVVPGFVGLEAGQSAFGDIYAWYKKLLAWPLAMLEDASLQKEVEDKILVKLSEEASGLELTEQDLVATDWLNGRRSPDVDFSLKGTITGLDLGTTAPMIFKALVEATAFGSKAIIERLKENDISIAEVIALGGVAKKSDFVMQTLSNVLNLPIKIAKSFEACALGSAMYASVVAGVHASLEAAQKAIGEGVEKEYKPQPDKVVVYQKLYQKYKGSNFLLY